MVFDLLKNIFHSPVDLTDLINSKDLSSIMSFIATDAQGKIIYLSSQGQIILRDLAKQKKLPPVLENQPLEKILGKPFRETVLGLTISSKEEIVSQLLQIGRTNYVVTTKLLQDEKTGAITGCIACYVKTNPQSDHTVKKALSSFIKNILHTRNYNIIGWVDHISASHAIQLIQCVLNVGHKIRIPDYCPYKEVCAFHPINGYCALDRRSYARFPIEKNLRISLETSQAGMDVAPDLKGKFIHGSSLDISAGGIRFFSPLRFPPGCVLKIHLENEPPIRVNAEVVWLTPQNNGFVHGCKFIDLNPQASATILQLIYQFQIADK